MSIFNLYKISADSQNRELLSTYSNTSEVEIISPNFSSFKQLASANPNPNDQFIIEWGKGPKALKDDSAFDIASYSSEIKAFVFTKEFDAYLSSIMLRGFLGEGLSIMDAIYHTSYPPYKQLDPESPPSDAACELGSVAQDTSISDTACELGSIAQDTSTT